MGLGGSVESPVLVTAGNGTLGRLVVSRLRNAGRDVRVLSPHSHEGERGIRGPYQPPSELHESCAAAEVLTVLEPELTTLRAQVRDVYVHLDVDVLDPAEVQTNEYQPDGGLSERQILEALDDIGRTLRIRAAGIASYDPAPDPSGRATRVVSRIITHLLAGSKPK